jgi:hypothetical protein
MPKGNNLGWILKPRRKNSKMKKIMNNMFNKGKRKKEEKKLVKIKKLIGD